MSDADLAGPESADAAAPMPPPPGPGSAGRPAPVPHAGARYALLRLLTLVVVGAVLYVVGMRGWLLAFAAVLVSGLVSLVLLVRQRNDAAVNLEHTVDHWKQRHAHDEDDADDRGEVGPPEDLDSLDGDVVDPRDEDAPVDDADVRDGTEPPDRPQGVAALRSDAATGDQPTEPPPVEPPPTEPGPPVEPPPVEPPPVEPGPPVR